MSSENLPAVELITGPNPDAAVIWLHGLGADGHDFEPLVPQLGLEAQAIRFVFPHAPVQAVTLNGGMAMRSWYDIYDLGSTRREDERGILQTARAIEALVRRERDRGVTFNRIVLAGFSQGGAMALHVGLRFRENLAGIMGLSTYLPLHASIEAQRSRQNTATPIFLAHGNQDPVVDFSFGTRSRDFLSGLGYSVEWHEYPMPHAVCAPEIQDIGRWLLDRLQ